MRSRLFIALVLAAIFSTSFFVPAVNGAQKDGDDGTLQHPSGELLYYLYYQRANLKVPYESFAEIDPAYQKTNEFNRDKVKAEIVARMRASTPDMKNVRYVTLRVEGKFGTYDFRHQEFDFELDNSMDLSYMARGGANILVRLTNGGAASIWPMAPERGKALLGQLHGQRRVMLDMRTEVLGAEEMGYEPNRIDIRGRLNVKILEMDVYTPDGSTLLDHLKVDGK